MDDVTKVLFNAKTADEVRDLIARGADPLAVQDDYPHIPLYFHEEDVVRALIAAGCDTDRPIR